MARRNPTRRRRRAHHHVSAPLSRSAAAPAAALDFSFPEADDADETPVERQARLFEEMQQAPRPRPDLKQALGTRMLLYVTMALFVGTVVFSILRFLEAR